MKLPESARLLPYIARTEKNKWSKAPTTWQMGGGARGHYLGNHGFYQLSTVRKGPSMLPYYFQFLHGTLFSVTPFKESDMVHVLGSLETNIKWVNLAKSTETTKRHQLTPVKWERRAREGDFCLALEL